ncbi:MAG: hypothetical protein WBN81_17440, partial [Gammaproteobacteria bacterium]
HYWGEGMANVQLTGRISGEDKTYQTGFAFPAVATVNPEMNACGLTPVSRKHYRRSMTSEKMPT